jgi:hypothetical protein
MEFVYGGDVPALPISEKNQMKDWEPDPDTESDSAACRFGFCL